MATNKSRLAKLEGVKRGAFVPPAKILSVSRRNDGIILNIDRVTVGADKTSQAQAEQIIANHPRIEGQVTVIEIIYPADEDAQRDAAG
jgi:trehalose-6-phosphate synthase